MVQIGDMTIQDEATILPGSFIGNFTRLANAAAGDVGYTGVGFRPSSVHFRMAESPIGVTNRCSSGHDNGTNAGCMFRQDSSTDGWSTSPNRSIYWVGSGISQTGFIASMDADGFTITWVTSGSPPANTLNVQYVAYK